jgi:hypothetical protein
VVLRFSCKNLIDMDTFSKSDPMVVVYMKSGGEHSYSEVGRTEMIKDNLNPRFVKSLELDYRFETMQRIRFCVYDVDNDSDIVDKQDFIGMVETTLGDVVAEKEFVRELLLESEKKEKTTESAAKARSRGTLTVSSEQVMESRSDIIFEFSGTKLDKKDFFGKSGK